MASENPIIGIVGRRGSGKSMMARRVLECCDRLILWDPMGEHSWCPNHLDNIADFEGFMAWADSRENFASRYVPDDLEEEFAPLAETVYEYGDLVLGIEEAPMLCSPSALPYEFDRVVRLGRHQGVSLVWTAQRLVETARRLTAATDYFILFSHTEPRDLDGIAERCGSEVVRQVADLPRHGFLVYDVIEGRESDLAHLIAQLRGEPMALSRALSHVNVVTGAHPR
jgi:hypothetical protein